MEEAKTSLVKSSHLTLGAKQGCYRINQWSGTETKAVLGNVVSGQGCNEEI